MKSPFLLMTLATLGLSVSIFEAKASTDTLENSLDQTLGALAAGAPATPRQQELCSNLEEKLLSLHVAGNVIEPAAYKAADAKLKDHWTKICAEGKFDEAKLDSVSRDMVELGESLAYLKVFASSGAQARILGPYLAKHEACAPGCGYVSWGIWGDTSHQSRRSCHNSGDAIDIHAVRCGGSVQAALTPRFDEYVGCMRQEFRTILYRVRDHFGHSHIQLNDCRMISGREARALRKTGYLNTSTPAKTKKVKQVVDASDTPKQRQKRKKNRARAVKQDTESAPATPNWGDTYFSTGN